MDMIPFWLVCTMAACVFIIGSLIGALVALLLVLRKILQTGEKMGWTDDRP